MKFFYLRYWRESLNDWLFIFNREVRQIFHDGGALLFFIFLPLGYPILYSLIYTTESVHNVPIVVIDEDRSATSREYLRKVDATPDVRIVMDCPNMEEAKGISVRYVKPTFEDAYAVTNPTPFTLVRDSASSLWTVPLTEDVYRITIDIASKTLTGELFRPWNELFILGGATECGWVTYTFLPFTRDENEVCTWDWTGELRERSEFGEPRRFKFNGQNAWEPKVLHPFSQDEDILQSTQICTGGSADNKWSIREEGYYHIRVDVFRETVQAEYLGASPTESDGQATKILSPNRGENDEAVYDLSGRRVRNNSSLSRDLPRGIYIIGGKLVAR